MIDDKWVSVPRKLTFGMRIALEEAIIRHDKDLDRVWREVLDFAPSPDRKFDSIEPIVDLFSVKNDA